MSDRGQRHELDVLARAIDQMAAHHFRARQVEGEVRHWHPTWSKPKIAAMVRREEFAYQYRHLPRLAPAHGVGQGKPEWQRSPYYRGQKPSLVTRFAREYKNPQWAAPLRRVAISGLTSSDLAFIRKVHADNSLKFGANARWLAHHPALVAAALATVTIGPEVDPYLLAASDALSGYSGAKAAVKGRYSEAALDLGAFGFGRLAAGEARLAKDEARVAAKASASRRAAQREVQEAESNPNTPAPLKAQLARAQNAFRGARHREEVARRVEADAQRAARFLAYLAAFYEEKR